VRREDASDLSPEALGEKMEMADFQKMEQIRARANELVEDPDTADALKPWYRQFCKRPCFHDDYLPTFNRPNVELVDTQGQGVERITNKGVVVGGTEYELDCLIFATGFEVGTEYTRRAGYDIIGRGGLKLSEKWEDGMRTLHGMHCRGFPNCFVMSPSQAGFTANFPHSLNEQSEHIAYIVKTCMDSNHRVVEATQEGEDEWVETIIRLARFNRKFLEECTPGYYNNEGKPGERSGQNAPYGAGSVAFFKLLEDWRTEGSMKGLEAR
jgi:cyclohexanone monooxygenase